jgi:hypothetical protein
MGSMRAGCVITGMAEAAAGEAPRASGVDCVHALDNSARAPAARTPATRALGVLAREASECLRSLHDMTR